MPKPIFIKRVVFCLMTILFCLGVDQKAAAHGEGQTVELTAVSIGPYFLSVYSSPGILRVGEIHFSSIVMDAAQQPVTDCEVLVVVTPAASPDRATELQARPATPGTNYMHEMELDIKENGRYQVAVTVIDPAGNGGEASFAIDVIHTPLWLRIPLLFSVGLTFFFGLLLLRQALQAIGLWQPLPAPTRTGAAHISRPVSKL